MTRSSLTDITKPPKSFVIKLKGNKTGANIEYFDAGQIKDVCVFNFSNKTFLELKPNPKNKDQRPVFITEEIMEILKRREAFRISCNDFVFMWKGDD